jgi:hypothetical protein
VIDLIVTNITILESVVGTIDEAIEREREGEGGRGD